MREPGYSDALRSLREAAGGDLQQVIDAACGPVPAWDAVVYLSDFSGEMLFPLAAGAPTENVAGSMAGRAFAAGRPVTSERDDGVRVWVPVSEQASRTGVLAVTVRDATAAIVEQVVLLGVFTGLVVAAAARVSDIPYIRRQGREMSLAAGMQWDLLPPLNTRTPGATIVGLLEPAYNIAGDAFDYAVGEGVLDFAIIDGVGHGIGSTLLTGLAIGAYRHARRSGAASVTDIHRALDLALTSNYDDDSFATGIIGRLTFSTGRLEWSCAGHPPPLLLRGRKVVAELANEPVLPFGLRGKPELMTADLEPDDAVLLYTDGVTESRAPDGDLFGLDKLIDLLEQEAASNQQPEEVLRRLVQALLDYQPGGLRDDATLLLVQWTGRAP